MAEHTDHTRTDIKRIRAEFRRLLEKAAVSGNAEEFIKWLQKYGNHLSLEQQAQTVAQFKQIVADEAGKRRRRK